MIISTKGRYALRVLIALAETNPEQFVPLKVIAEEQHLPQKYMESIMTMLSKANIVEGAHGKGGGYRLNCKAEELTIGTVLHTTEKSMAPVSCLEKDAESCGFESNCKTVKMWTGLYKAMNDYLDSVTLDDLINGN